MSRSVIEQQRKFAMRSIKKRNEAEDESVEAKVDKIVEKQEQFETALEQITESIGSFIQTLKEEGHDKPKGGKEPPASPAHVTPSVAAAEAHRPPPDKPPGIEPPSHREPPPPPVVVGSEVQPSAAPTT